MKRKIIRIRISRGRRTSSENLCLLYCHTYMYTDSHAYIYVIIGVDRIGI